MIPFFSYSIQVDTSSAEVPGGKYIGQSRQSKKEPLEGFRGGPMPAPEGMEKPSPNGPEEKGPAGPPNMGGGRLQIHTLTTPLVEVADDVKTAKALWMSPGLETGGHVGDLAGSWAWEKFYVEFICENDKWYIWHFHQIDILCSFFYKSWTDDFFTHSLMHVPEEYKTFDQKWEFINKNNRSGNPLTKTYFYDQEIAPFMDVELPEPYETY